MTINTFDQKLPSGFYQMHMAKRLDIFIVKFILPRLFTEGLIKKSDITMGIINTDRMVLRYCGYDLGFINMVGSDFSFFKK